MRIEMRPAFDAIKAAAGQAALRRAAAHVAAKARATVHVGPDHRDGSSHLRDDIRVIEEDGRFLVGSDKSYAAKEEYHVGGARGGSHAYLRPALYTRYDLAKLPALSTPPGARGKVHGPMTEAQHRKKEQAKVDRAYNRMIKRKEGLE